MTFWPDSDISIIEKIGTGHRLFFVLADQFGVLAPKGHNLGGQRVMKLEERFHDSS